MAVDYGSLPFAEALAFFKAKLNLPTKRWDDLLGAAHDRAFVVAGAMQADLLMDLRAAVDKAIADGTTFETFKKDFKQIVAARGWTGWTGEGTKAGEAWRARVIYDTNLFASYSAGRTRQMKEIAHVRPWWRYRHSDASVVPRPEHLAWDGLILRHDDPFWASHSPPNGWGCKCYLETLADRDMKRLGLEPTNPARIPANAIDPKTGLPQGVDKGWDYQPGANRTTPLYDLIARKLPTLDAPLGAAMWAALRPMLTIEMNASYQKWLDEILKDPVKRGRMQVVGSLAPNLLVWLQTQKNIAPVTAEIAVQDGLIVGAKARRHTAAGDALTSAEWRKLPDMLETPTQTLFDTRSGKLLYIYTVKGTNNAKIAVEFDYQQKREKGAVNRVVSAFKTEQAAIDAEIKGGHYEIVK